MKTHMDIDAKLLADAVQLGGHRTKREAVEAALREYCHGIRRQRVLDMAGKVEWIGDLDVMRGRVKKK